MVHAHSRDSALSGDHVLNNNSTVEVTEYIYSSISFKCNYYFFVSLSLDYLQFMLL